jgi:hypothetical protein
MGVVSKSPSTAGGRPCSWPSASRKNCCVVCSRRPCPGQSKRPTGQPSTLSRPPTDKVEPRYRESAVAFNLARLDYACQRYRPALASLQQDLFDDVLLNLSAKIVQAKCFQELGEHDLLEAHLEAMRKYIRRHKELGQYAARYLNFTTALRCILRAQEGQRKTVWQETNAMLVLAEKDWLLEQ